MITIAILVFVPPKHPVKHMPEPTLFPIASGGQHLVGIASKYHIRELAHRNQDVEQVAHCKESGARSQNTGLIFIIFSFIKLFKGKGR